MSIRIHTADAANCFASYIDYPADYFEDDEMAVGPALVIEDPGNCEAFVMVGPPAEIERFAREILDRLPKAP